MRSIHPLPLLSVISLLLCVGNAAVVLPDDISDDAYDFIIIGGGTAGSVMADRLSENSSIRVLVLEAGVSNEGVQESIVPFFCPQFYPTSPWSWNYTTVPQAGLAGRTIPYPRGRLLGGSSSINFLVYTRGSSNDYDRWVDATGDPGWSWNALQPYFKKSEGFVLPVDQHNITGEFEPGAHGFSGALNVSLPGFARAVDQRVLRTTSELASEFPFNVDMNDGCTVGVGWTQATIGGKARSSAATAFLAPRIMDRSNLDIILNAQVTRLVSLPQMNGSLSVTSLDFTHLVTGNRYHLSAKKEIILSAGTINTPQLLLLSGIGDSTALADLNISSTLHLPDVGKNLHDHPMIPSQFFANSTDTFDTIQQNMTLFNELLAEWTNNGTGQFVDGLSNLIGWLRLPDAVFARENFSDPSAGPCSAHYEMIYSNGFASFAQQSPTTGNYFSILSNPAAPLSRGSVTLRTRDPLDFPNIDPGLLNHPVDMFMAVEAIKASRRFLNASAWDGYITGRFDNAKNVDTVEELEAYARNVTTTMFHPVGTASMSAVGSNSGVVDPDLRVKGVQGLRIIDASVIPFIPSAHTQASVYVIAERGADMVKKAWGLL